MVTINISNKVFYLLVGIISILTITGVTIAYGDFINGDPSIMGHTSDEIKVNISGIEYGLQEAIDGGMMNEEVSIGQLSCFDIVDDGCNTGWTGDAGTICSDAEYKIDLKNINGQTACDSVTSGYECILVGDYKPSTGTTSASCRGIGVSNEEDDMVKCCKII